MNPVVSNVGSSYYHTLGYLKASPDGSKIAAANSRFIGVSASNVTSDINLFDFDNSSGILSNPMTFDFPFNGNNGNIPYGLEFSPSSSILYVASSESPNKLTQFNLLAGTENLINNSVGVAEHPDVMDSVEKELGIMAEYDDKLAVLEKYFGRDFGEGKTLLNE